MASRGRKRADVVEQEDVLQAVIIADSFDVRFAPITKDVPRQWRPKHVPGDTRRANDRELATCLHKEHGETKEISPAKSSRLLSTLSRLETQILQSLSVPERWNTQHANDVVGVATSLTTACKTETCIPTILAVDRTELRLTPNT
ncbi:Translation initiation factor eIF-2B subunit epsilon [Branchiostoma belcheri]|nr:Translation initiation factor eIF-2B subunit epsilon [Branchiostoma belcheri]